MNKALHLIGITGTRIIALMVMLCFPLGISAQSDTTNPQVICIGSIENYQVDQAENGGQGTPGSTYTWSITSGAFAGTITPNQGPSGSSNRIQIDWGASAPGPYVLQVIEETSDGCPGLPITLNIQLTPEITPSFNTIGPLCQNSTPPSLPATSLNGITGTWSPAVINTATAGTATYTFTPDPDQCAVVTTLDIEITPEVTPTFPIVPPICQNAAAPSLPSISIEGITGTWSPASISTSAAGTTTYTFTPNDPAQCAIPTTLDITITPEVTPSFTAIGPLCQNSTPPNLDGTSLNGITGTWAPASISTSAPGTTTYTFTPNDPAQCAIQTTLDIIVTPEVTPTFPIVPPVCQNATAPSLPSISNEGITGTWNATVSTSTPGTSTYTFTPDNPAQCAIPATIDIVVNPLPTVTVSDQSICSGESTTLTASGADTYTWDPPAGLSATTGASVDASPASTTTYTVTGTDANGCQNTATATVTVNPLPTTSPIFHD